MLNGLGRTLPLGALTPGAIGLSAASAHALGLEQLTAGAGPQRDGARRRRPTQRLRVSAVLGTETVGVLSGARVGVMPLASMQSLLGQPRRVTRILCRQRPEPPAR